MRKIYDWFENYTGTIMYVLFCIYAYFSGEATLHEIPLPKIYSGISGIILAHIIILFGIIGGFILHWIVELISKIFK